MLNSRQEHLNANTTLPQVLLTFDIELELICGCLTTLVPNTTRHILVILCYSPCSLHFPLPNLIRYQSVHEVVSSGYAC